MRKGLNIDIMHLELTTSTPKAKGGSLSSQPPVNPAKYALC